MIKAKRGRAKTYNTDNLMMRSVMGILLIALGLLTAISIVGGIEGAAFSIIKWVMQGLGGSLCLGICGFLIWAGILLAISAHHRVGARAFLFLLLFFISLLAIINLISEIRDMTTLMEYATTNNGTVLAQKDFQGFWSTVQTGYQLCARSGASGGALGMLLAWPLWTYLGPTIGLVVLGTICLICVLFFTKFDFTSAFRHTKEETDEKLDQRQLEKEKQKYLRQMEREQAKAQAKEQTKGQAKEKKQGWLRRLFWRAEEDDGEETEPVAVAQPTAAPIPAAYPTMPGFAPVPGQMQMVQMPMQMPTTGMATQPAPMQDTGYMNRNPQPKAVLFDDTIVPELPNGSTPSDWTLRSRPLKATPSAVESTPRETRAPAVPEKPQAPTPKTDEAQLTQTMAKDRASSRVIAKMEENRRQKEMLQQRLDEAEGKVTTVPTMSPEVQRAIDNARKTGNRTRTNEPAADVAQAQAPQGAPSQPQPTVATQAVPPSPPNPYVAAQPSPQTNINAAQLAYARQTAGYTPPATPEEKRSKTAAASVSGDRYEAYKRPSTGQEPDGMSGSRLDIPDLKLPSRPPETEAETTPEEPKPYPYPMIELLNLQMHALPDTRELDHNNALRLEKTLESFGIPAKVQRVTHGPAVTRFELGLVSSGINVKRIMNIADNIALDMAANGDVRIEVPIPGTTLFGVEVPNKEIISVSLAEVLTSPEMTSAKSPLTVALGKDIAGRPVLCDLAKMPHLLIAGQTGSGKSVCINSIINSLLFRASPEEVRMIMIDPKVVELQGYNSIPHLLIPVVSDPHKAAGALNWAVNEMLDRYHKMQSKGVRDITSYNMHVKEDEPRLPRIVIIIDELSDLMLACKKEVEESIIRLAQLARAAGIHVVVATQRPTVNVITGLIKANIPSRIAFAVASSIDSRTILDMNGAEKLLGKGDMFYYPTGAKAPVRVQGCYLSDTEISDVTQYIVDNSKTDYNDKIDEIMSAPEIVETDDEPEDYDSGDKRLKEAVEIALADGQASISMLQRRMKMGYARAGRLIDDMTVRGIISRSAGPKPRDVLISYEYYLEHQDELLN